MSIDLHIVNRLWFAAREEAPNHGIPMNRLDYSTALMIGIVLFRHPEIAQEFIDEAWEKERNEMTITCVCRCVLEHEESLRAGHVTCRDCGKDICQGCCVEVKILGQLMPEFTCHAANLECRTSNQEIPL